MLIRVGETTRPGPDGQPLHFRVVQALDPVTEFPIAQVPVPIEQAELVGDALAGRDVGSGILLPGEDGAPPVPPDMTP